MEDVASCALRTPYRSMTPIGNDVCGVSINHANECGEDQRLSGNHLCKAYKVNAIKVKPLS